MLKRFFISFAGSMAAIWLSALLAVVLFIVFVATLVAKFEEKSVQVHDHSVLVVDLTGEIDERPGQPTVRDIIVSDGEIELTQGLNQIISSINEAANDPNIDGIYIKVGGSTAGMASRMAIVEALDRFKKSKKWVLAYGNYYDQGDYIVATAADELYVNPQGVVNIAGLSATTPFFKELLDKVGVEMQIFKVGTYKSAVEPFILTQMSEASREQQVSYLNAIWDSLASQIASARGVDSTQVNAWADSICTTWSAQRLIDNKIVNDAIYEHDMMLKLAKLTDNKDIDDINFVTTTEYAKATNIDLNPLDMVDNNDKIAVLYAVGDITDETGDGIVASQMLPVINDLIDDESVKGLVLRVNSSGGSAFASEQIWEALKRFKDSGRPFYVSMGDVAASGGYYISCGADKIFAQPQTLTGSIGIFGMVPCAKTLLNDKLGINTATVSTNGAPMTIVEPFSPAQAAAMQRRIEEGYATFIGRCADGRGMTPEQINAIGQGRVWSGQQALERGLVDQLGTLSSTIDAIKADHNLSSCKVVEYPSSDNNIMQQILEMQAETATKQLDQHLGQAAPLYHAIDRITNLEPVQCRMEQVILH